MTDFELTVLCAHAIGGAGAGAISSPPTGEVLAYINHQWVPFDPLNNDGQAMSLQKKLEIQVWPERDRRSVAEGPGKLRGWCAFMVGGQGTASEPTLNRAIVVCAARMHAEKEARVAA